MTVDKGQDMPVSCGLEGGLGDWEGAVVCNQRLNVSYRWLKILCKCDYISFCCNNGSGWSLEE